MPDATIDIHLHLPAGAQKKDGPSAGVAMVRCPLFLNGNLGAKMTVVQVCAIVSLLTGKCVPPTTAMTGEVRKNNSPLPIHTRPDISDVCRSHSADGSHPLAGSKKRCWARIVRASAG